MLYPRCYALDDTIDDISFMLYLLYITIDASIAAISMMLFLRCNTLNGNIDAILSDQLSQTHFNHTQSQQSHLAD